MDIKIPEAQMQDIVAQAIFKTLDDSARTTIIQEAIAYLITKPQKKDYYSAEPKSPLQLAFHNAIEFNAAKIIREQIETDPAIKEKIKALFAEAMTKTFDTHREETVGRIASALGNAFTRD